MKYNQFNRVNNMDPRIAMFQRKPSPDMEEAPNDTGPQALDDGSEPAADTSTVMCPNCQCEFDPTTGEVLNAPAGDDTGGDAGGEYQIPDTIMPGSEEAPQ